MIQVNELRIGNYISRLDLVSRCTRIEKVLELGIEKVTTTGAFKVICFYDEINPIPITGEVKHQIDKNKDIFIDNIGFVIFKNSYQYAFVWEDYPYLHQIQNLFFEITRKELISK